MCTRLPVFARCTATHGRFYAFSRVRTRACVRVCTRARIHRDTLATIRRYTYANPESSPAAIFHGARLRGGELILSVRRGGH